MSVDEDRLGLFDGEVVAQCLQQIVFVFRQDANVLFRVLFATTLHVKGMYNIVKCGRTYIMFIAQFILCRLSKRPKLDLHHLLGLEGQIDACCSNVLSKVE